MTPPDELPFEAIARLLDVMNCGVMIVNRAGRVVHANPPLCEMYARPASDLIGQAVSTFYGEDKDRAFLAQRIEEFDKPYQGEFFVERPDGNRIPVIIAGRHVGDYPALADLRVITVMDITAQKNAEKHLTEEYKTISQLSDTVLEQAIDLKHHSERLEQKVRERTLELHDANIDSITMLAVASEAKDLDTGAHVRRIKDYTEQLAAAMGLDNQTVDRFGYSAILHDVGKMAVPDAILKKPGRLTAEERRLIETHTVAGERILSDKPFFETARRIARHHHENWDGSGYPDGIQGDAIPLAARIVRLVDVYDALVSKRVYKPAWSRADAIEAIERGTGTLFDPQVAAAFESVRKSGGLRSAADPE